MWGHQIPWYAMLMLCCARAPNLPVAWEIDSSSRVLRLPLQPRSHAALTHHSASGPSHASATVAPAGVCSCPFIPLRSRQHHSLLFSFSGSVPTPDEALDRLSLSDASIIAHETVKDKSRFTLFKTEITTDKGKFHVFRRSVLVVPACRHRMRWFVILCQCSLVRCTAHRTPGFGHPRGACCPCLVNIFLFFHPANVLFLAKQRVKTNEPLPLTDTSYNAGRMLLRGAIRVTASRYSEFRDLHDKLSKVSCHATHVRTQRCRTWAPRVRSHTADRCHTVDPRGL